MSEPEKSGLFSRLRSLPRRAWLIFWVVSVLAIGGTVTAVAISVAAEQAAAEQAAAEKAAAEQAAAEKAAAEQAAAQNAAAEREAARLVSAKENAAATAVRGEARYADSVPWADEAPRVELRAALDALIDQSDASPSAEDLESAIDAVTRAMEVVGAPPSPVGFVCGDIDAGVDFTVHSVNLNPDGSGQYADIWASQLRCDNSMTGDSVEESVRIQTPMQKAAVAAAKEAGYEEFNDYDEEILYSVYRGCAESGSASYYSGSTALSDAQVKEVKAYLTICPDHPDVEQWRVAISAGEEERKAEANGTRVSPGGTYEVPSQMARGTFVAEGVDGVNDCYWETRDANGNIIDNNFVLAAPRVVAVVTSDAVVFTTDGGCGYWNRQ